MNALTDSGMYDNVGAGVNESGDGVSLAAVRESADEGSRHVAIQPRRQSARSAQLRRSGRQRAAGQRRTTTRRRLRQPHSGVHHRRQQRALRGRPRSPVV